jgi:hypothetical protein
MTTDADPEATAALAAAQRLLRDARRPRCWRCRERMDRDLSGRFWHCVVAGCPGSLLAVDSELLWEPQD